MRLVRLQGRLVVGNAGVDALIDRCVVEEQRRVDLRHLFGRDLSTVVRHAGIQRGAGGGDPVHHASPPAEPHTAHFARRFRMLRHEGHGTGQTCDAFRSVQGAEQLPHLRLVGRRSAVRRQDVGGERQEALDAKRPRDILDVRVETAILVDDDDRGRFWPPLRRAR
jgi:hypothetical protein